MALDLSTIYWFSYNYDEEAQKELALIDVFEAVMTLQIADLKSSLALSIS